jgi:glyoxylase-like metal-dependent hydrolase (beta-lactamase superfamily II)
MNLGQVAGSGAAYNTQAIAESRNLSTRRGALAIGRVLSSPPLNTIRSFHKPPGVSLSRDRARYSTTSVVGKPTIHDIFEKSTQTWQYIVADPATSRAVIIDPVLDYNPTTQDISTVSADALLALTEEKGYIVEKILETHAHADHITAASYLQRRITESQGHRPQICIGRRIIQVQELFSERYGVPIEEYEGVFDELLDDDEVFDIGELKVTAIHLPGHTPDHLGYMVGGAY